MKIRLGFQLAAVFAVPALALTLIVAGVLVSFAQLRSAKADMLVKTSLRAKTRDVMLRAISARYFTRGFTLTQKTVNLNSEAKEIAAANDDISFLHAHAALIPGFSARADQVSDLIAQLDTNLHLVMKADRSAILDANLHGNSSAVDAGPYKAIMANNAVVKKLEPLLTSMIAEASDSAEASSSGFDRLMQTVGAAMLAFGLLAIVATILIFLIVTRRITARLGRISHEIGDMVASDIAALSRALGRLAAGDLRVAFASAREPIADSNDDEVADLVRSYNELANGLATIGRELTSGTAQLRELVGGVVHTSQSLALASDQASTSANQASVAVEQIARSIDSVARDAKDQALKIAQATAAVEELARTAEQIADVATHQAISIQAATDAIDRLDGGIESLSSHGGDLARSAREASTEAATGMGAVSETQSAMKRLRDVSEHAAGAMKSLEERSSQVEEIVRTIEEIADQTNLLALNAAIEAAQRSSIATREISQILTAIRRETLTAADAMRTSSESMEGGIGVAERASASLIAVGSAIGTTTTVADELAGRAREMREASNRVTESMAGASAAVEENAAAASQMRTTTHDVTQTMVPVAQAADQQSLASHEAAISTSELAAGVQEIDATARALRDQAERLASLVTRFTIGDEDGDTASISRENLMALT